MKPIGGCPASSRAALSSATRPAKNGEEELVPPLRPHSPFMTLPETASAEMSGSAPEAPVRLATLRWWEAERRHSQPRPELFQKLGGGSVPFSLAAAIHARRTSAWYSGGA